MSALDTPYDHSRPWPLAQDSSHPRRRRDGPPSQRTGVERRPREERHAPHPMHTHLVLLSGRITLVLATVAVVMGCTNAGQLSTSASAVAPAPLASATAAATTSMRLMPSGGLTEEQAVAEAA